MQNRIFRSVALERLSSPEQLDLLMQVTSPRAWIALVGVLVLLSVVVFWGFAGSVPITIRGEGILLRGGSGITSITAPADGIVSDIYVGIEDVVESGQVIARIQQTDVAENIPVRTTFSGRILEILAAQDVLVQLGQPMLVIEPSTGEDFEAILYLPASDGKRVQPGQKVQLLPSTVRAEEVGVMQGWVTSVGEFPESKESMSRLLDNQSLIDYFFNTTNNAPIEVRVMLIPSRTTPTGYQWTTPQGPDTELRSGTLTVGTIILSEQAPINLIFSGLAQ
jgi:hypothetical protein